MNRLDAANDHDTGKQIARTRQIWQPRIGRDLTDEDARQIMHNVTGFFGVLAEWARAEKTDAKAAAVKGSARRKQDRPRPPPRPRSLAMSDVLEEALEDTPRR